MPSTPELHDLTDRAHTLEDVVAELRADGYAVAATPALADVPAFAAAIRPDVVARRASGGVLVVVRTRAELADDPAILAVASAARVHPEWRLDVLVRPEPA